MNEFLLKNVDELSTCEYLLPDVLNAYSIEKNIQIKLIPTSAVWRGVTYLSDLEELKKQIKRMIDNGEYPINLYE